ncbi:hypothetical protein HYPSUDRAFT_41592 [Hypholoma sublateritium FD-334 SS-4]|uniref:Transmembrane protein n=1 Tax=Hypholoma sublateritium (strain FD-334 SS-4) TaxID=945553 RepID=A0A0D2NZ68_HYPSF|nr:hypothetical protein HYPSUDRAFT_41592 [Hypholoma sublateritium FD-334 SS-4]
MSSQQLRVILDDNVADFIYGPNWELNAQVEWYQGGTHFPSYNRTTFGFFNLSFEGTSIAFIGNTPAPSSSQMATISIDGGTPYNSSYGSPPGQQTYVQWYQSPLLSDGVHTVSVDHLDGTAIDMAIITVGPNTPLTNRSIFVDNNDPSIEYTGHWVEDESISRPGNLPSGPPIGNSTQTSTTPGDTINFRFSGTSISVYGVFGWENIGSISATYTLDDITTSQTYTVAADSPERTEGDATNFIFYSKNNLAPEPHTLSITITGVVNQAYRLDYLVYSPSFSSQAAMPNLPAVTVTAASATNTAQTANIPRKGGAPVAAIVGSTLGSVLAVLLLVALVMLFRKRRKRGWEAVPMLDTHQSAFTDGQA